MRCSAGSSSNIEHHPFEVLDDALPGEVLGLRARRAAQGARERRRARETLGGGDERGLVVDRREQRRAPVLEMGARGGVVVGDDAQAARHGLESHVAESLGGAWEEEYIGRG